MAWLTRLAAAGIGQGDMYHIFAAKRHRQDGAPFGKYQALRGPPPPTRQAWSSLLAAVLAGVGGMDQQRTLPCAGGSFDALGAGDQRAAAGFEAQAVERLAWRSAASIRSPRSAGTSTSPVLKARASAPLSLPLALASSSALRPTPIQAPRPGARARTSGATWPSGTEGEPDQLLSRRRPPR